MKNEIIIDKNSISIFEKGSITIDGKTIGLVPGDMNIVDVAARAKVGIPAPCYQDKRGDGCCEGCVVEIGGKKTFACSTFPQNGMEVIVNRPDLKSLRKERIQAYQKTKSKD